MAKVKINSGFASIILVASLFAGWQVLLITLALLIIFCDIDEQFKNVILRVVTFYIGFTIVTYIWDLFVEGKDVLINAINNIFRIINSYLSYENQIDATKIQNYLINPLSYTINSLDDILQLVFAIIKIIFIIDTLRSKNMKDNFISLKIRKYIDNTLEYISKININSENDNKIKQKKEEFNPDSYES